MLLGLLYYFFDPLESKWAPKCMFRLLTGWDCPGCGSQRAVHALLHGDFGAAWEANPFLLCVLPLLALMGYAAAVRVKRPRLYAALNSIPMIAAISAALLLWFLLRNLL